MAVAVALSTDVYLYRRQIKRFGFIAVILGCMLFSNGVCSEKPGDADALKGITRGSVIWDVTVGNPGRLLFLMKVIEETYTDLQRQNVKPDMIFLFHGPVVKLISTNSPDLPLEEEESYEEVVRLIRKMSKLPGVKMESCSISARMLGIDSGAIIPGINPVGNTFVSQIGYQQKGYATIPVN